MLFGCNRSMEKLALEKSSISTEKNPEYHYRIAIEQHGYTLPDFDHSSIHSPINILSKPAATAEKSSVTLHFNDEINAIEMLGHTV